MKKIEAPALGATQHMHETALIPCPDSPEAKGPQAGKAQVDEVGAGLGFLDPLNFLSCQCITSHKDGSAKWNDPVDFANHPCRLKPNNTHRSLIPGQNNHGVRGRTAKGSTWLYGYECVCVCIYIYVYIHTLCVCLHISISIRT